MRKSLLKISMVLLLLFLAGLPIFAADDSDYYPLKAGNRWEYRITINGSSVSIVQVIGVINVVDDIARLGIIRNGLPVAEIYYTRNGSGVYKTKQITAFGTTSYQPVQPLIFDNMAVGKDWNWEADDKSKKENVKVIASEKVTVPAGTFDAVILNYEGVDNGAPYSEKTWFVKGIGYVKNVQVDKGQTITTELIKYIIK